MALQVTRMVVPQSQYRLKCPYLMNMEGICVHNTANKASAMSEASYMINNGNYVSFHVAIDDYRAVECIPENRNAFHAGDGAYGNGNRNFYSVEICYSTGDSNLFSASEKNAAYYIACKLKEHGWGIDKVRKHQDFSGKYCPHKTLDLGWQRFLNLIKRYLNNQYVGWIKDNTGWWYQNSDGSYPKNKWLKLDAWYYFNEKGYAITGWKKIDGKWYFFDSNCRMKTGWVSDKGNWFFLNNSGQMLENEWYKDGDKWYWLKKGGYMAKSEAVVIGKEKFYFDSDGHMTKTNQRGALI